MTAKFSDVHFGLCALCGFAAELKPYGPDNEEICFKCGMKDEDTTRRAMRRVVFKEYDA
jgi:hypothetical protein